MTFWQKKKLLKQKDSQNRESAGDKKKVLSNYNQKPVMKEIGLISVWIVIKIGLDQQSFF